MNKYLVALVMSGLTGASVTINAAEQTLDEFRQHVEGLRKQERELTKQRDTVHKERKEAEFKLVMWKNEDTLNEAIASLEVRKPKKPRTVLIYSRTKGYRHQSIPYGIHTLTELGKRTGAFNVIATEDPEVFTSEHFMKYDGIIMLNTTGNDTIPKGKARDAFEKFLEQDRGLIGIHAATDCHANWSNYLEAMGGIFDGHPWGANSVVTLYNEEPDHPICNHIHTGDQIKDEIYQYKDDEHFTREKLRILLSLDLSGPNMKKGNMKREDNDYAVAWVRKYKGSRVFYSNLGHNNETFHNKMALQHFLNGIQFALGDLEADARPSAEVGNGLAQPLPEGF